MVNSRPAGAGSSRWRSLAVVGMVGLAQAASLLVAIGISWRQPHGNPGTRVTPQISSAARVVQPSLDTEFDLEDGQVALLRCEGPQVRMLELTDLDAQNGEDPWFVFFNRVEAASTVVAMAE